MYSVYSEKMEELEQLRYLTAPALPSDLKEICRHNNAYMLYIARFYHIPFFGNEWQKPPKEHHRKEVRNVT